MTCRGLGFGGRFWTGLPHGKKKENPFFSGERKRRGMQEEVQETRRGPELSGHYSRDRSEYVNVIEVISEPFACEFR